MAKWLDRIRDWFMDTEKFEERIASYEVYQINEDGTETSIYTSRNWDDALKRAREYKKLLADAVEGSDDLFFSKTTTGYLPAVRIRRKTIPIETYT